MEQNITWKNKPTIKKNNETAKQTKSFLSQTFVPDQTSRQKTKEKNNTLWKILLR